VAEILAITVLVMAGLGVASLLWYFPGGTSGDRNGSNPDTLTMTTSGRCRAGPRHAVQVGEGPRQPDHPVSAAGADFAV
jgi:hypothetical protein